MLCTAAIAGAAAGGEEALRPPMSSAAPVDLNT